MPLFRPSAISPQSIQDMRDAITTHLSSPKNYVSNFYQTEPSIEIQDVENNIVINAEYPVMAGVLFSFSSTNQNFRIGDFNRDQLLMYRWAVISEEIL